jgi:hypothetical protein
VQYLDAYAVSLPAPLPATVAARALFQEAPGWVMALMRLRNALGRLVGLHSLAGAEALLPSTAPLQSGDSIGPFRTFAVAPTEVLLGLNDKHLDFRVSVLVETSAGGPATMWVSTAVQFHNFFGRLYFAVVRPFHGLVVRALLRRARAHLLAQA